MLTCEEVDSGSCMCGLQMATRCLVLRMGSGFRRCAVRMSELQRAEECAWCKYVKQCQNSRVSVEFLNESFSHVFISILASSYFGKKHAGIIRYPYLDRSPPFEPSDVCGRRSSADAFSHTKMLRHVRASGSSSLGWALAECGWC